MPFHCALFYWVLTTSVWFVNLSTSMGWLCTLWHLEDISWSKSCLEAASLRISLAFNAYPGFPERRIWVHEGHPESPLQEWRCLESGCILASKAMASPNVAKWYCLILPFLAYIEFVLDVGQGRLQFDSGASGTMSPDQPSWWLFIAFAFKVASSSSRQKEFGGSDLPAWDERITFQCPLSLSFNGLVEMWYNKWKV